ncbi:MAG TPA: NADP-dependent oxidoreductase [Hanamia sp.]|nr:NADP-dependent oxidoreductase [Hanamia sp.]
MKAAIISRFGPPEVLEIAEIAKPVPNDNEVLIKIKFAAINPVDTKVRAGTSGMSKNLQLPAILGWDVSGTIESVGKNVSSFKKEDEVFGCIGFPGLGKTYAEFAIANPKLITKKPSNVSFEEAAAVPLAGLTAYQAIYEHLKITKGQKILIQAAAGGVGHLAVQFAKLKGAFVTGTASGENESFLKSLGVDQFINYKKQKFEDVVQNSDAVLDAMGGKILYRSILCVKKGGKVVCLPSSSKNDPKAIELANHREIELIWPMMYPSGEEMTLIARLLEQVKLKVKIDKIFKLDEIVEAHKAIETHGINGKVIVKIT